MNISDCCDAAGTLNVGVHWSSSTTFLLTLAMWLTLHELVHIQASVSVSVICLPELQLGVRPLSYILGVTVQRYLGDDSSPVCPQTASIYFSTTLSSLLSSRYFSEWNYGPDWKPGVLICPFPTPSWSHQSASARNPLPFMSPLCSLPSILTSTPL